MLSMLASLPCPMPASPEYGRAEGAPRPLDGAVRFWQLWWNHCCLANSWRNYGEGVAGDLCSSMRVMLSCFSCVWLFATLWTEAHQAPLSMGFSRQEYWSGLPCPPPEDLPDSGMGTHICHVSCIGKQVLYHLCHLGSWNPYASPLPRPRRSMVEWRAAEAAPV